MKGSIQHPSPEDWFTELSAREILEQRYARGEIDQATFQQMREQLGGSSPS